MINTFIKSLMFSGILNKSFYDIVYFLYIKYHKIKTYCWFGLFLKKKGKDNCIINPIVFTPKCISLGNYVFIRNAGRIEGIFKHGSAIFNPQIILHNYVAVEQNVHITCANKIEIGNNTAIAANVTITDIEHPYEDILLPPERQQLVVKSVIIGEDCKIYNNVVLLPGTILGKHTVVAANSVVLGKLYPAFSILAGAPARIVKRYDIDSDSWRKINSNGDFTN